MCVECNSSDDFVYVPLPPSINLKYLNLKSEVDRRKIFETWRVPFIDANQMAAAGFYFTNESDVVRWVFFCGVEIGYWRDGDIALKEHQRWIPSCGFVKGCGLETFLLFLTASQRNHLNSLPEAATCASLISSYDPIPY